MSAAVSLRASDSHVRLKVLEFPLTRGECVDGPRPCPWTKCRSYLEDNETGETCALDVADRGEHNFEEVGAVLGMSKQRVQQIQECAIEKIREELRDEVLTLDVASPWIRRLYAQYRRGQRMEVQP